MRYHSRHCRRPAHVRSRPRRVKGAGTGNRGMLSRLLSITLPTVLLAATVAVAANAVSGVSSPTGPATEATALLGAWVKPTSYSWTDQQAAVDKLENQIGRKLAIDQTYVPWGGPLGRRPAWDITQGRVPMITFGYGA